MKTSNAIIVISGCFILIALYKLHLLLPVIIGYMIMEFICNLYEKKNKRRKQIEELEAKCKKQQEIIDSLNDKIDEELEKLDERNKIINQMNERLDNIINKLQ